MIGIAEQGIGPRHCPPSRARPRGPRHEGDAGPDTRTARGDTTAERLDVSDGTPNSQLPELRTWSVYENPSASCVPPSSTSHRDRQLLWLQAILIPAAIHMPSMPLRCCVLLRTPDPTATAAAGPTRGPITGPISGPISGPITLNMTLNIAGYIIIRRFQSRAEESTE